MRIPMMPARTGRLGSALQAARRRRDERRFSKDAIVSGLLAGTSAVSGALNAPTFLGESRRGHAASVASKT